MDATFRTPLLDVFRRGEAARDVRLLAAQGAVAPRPHEQLALLMLLVADQDPEIAAAAEATLQAIPASALAPFLARTDVPAETRGFFAQRGVEPAADGAATDVDTPLIEVEASSDAAANGVADDGEAEHIPALTKIRAMNVAQRIGLAMKGTREERAILIRDPNKIVGAAVLSSPKITDGEVEAIARMANVAEEILRMIAQTRAWMKNYAVVAALTRNPKTPVALSMNLLSRLNDRDLRMLSSDRNVPDVLRITARKKVVIDK
jgi:hypothetical protein